MLKQFLQRLIKNWIFRDLENDDFKILKTAPERFLKPQKAAQQTD